MLQPIVDITGNECRHIANAMPTSYVAAVTDQTVVKNSTAIDVLRFLQSIEEMGKQLRLLKFSLEVCLYVGLRSAPVAQLMRICGETNRL